MSRAPWLLLLGALALLGAAHPAPTVFDLSDEVGKIATPLTLTASTGAPLPVDGGGKPAYVFLFASWCEPCQESLPFVRAAYAKYGDRVRFVGVDVLEDASKAKAYVANADLPFPVAIFPIAQLDATVAPDVQLRSGTKYRIPADFLIDANGVVRYAWHGLAVDDKGDPVDVLPGYLAKLGIE
ncbi:MAG TPA: TlpA disulfide reductase family protein [Candidatus Baltobacteraceae bacterium]|nr:TlpA disulfide reductase family protein [Candidatus Baltobacteraceae bacterium]